MARTRKPLHRAPSRRTRAMGYRCIALAISLGSLCLCMGRPAAAAESDAGLWATVRVRESLVENVHADFALQTRFSSDIGTLERVLFRPSVSWRFAEQFTATLGYDAHLIQNPAVLTEHRVWQQLATGGEVFEVPISHRVRLEQRFIGGTGGTVVAARYRLGASFPIPETRLRLELGNEVFANLNGLAGGPRNGFDQNRATAELRIALNAGRSLTLGYMHQYLERRGEDLSNHALLVGLHWMP